MSQTADIKTKIIEFLLKFRNHGSYVAREIGPQFEQDANMLLDQIQSEGTPQDELSKALSFAEMEMRGTLIIPQSIASQKKIDQLAEINEAIKSGSMQLVKSEELQSLISAINKKSAELADFYAFIKVAEPIIQMLPKGGSTDFMALISAVAPKLMQMASQKNADGSPNEMDKIGDAAYKCIDHYQKYAELQKLGQ